VLNRVRRTKVRVKSDFARAHAEYVAMAASLQLITTQIKRSQFATAWLITTKGLAWLNERDA
jgi:hypothetical protein